MHREFVSECAEHLREGARRIEKCLDMLDSEQIWKQYPSVVSIGNQVIHLEGNVTQWILHVLGGEDHVRDRSSEFSPDQTTQKQELVARITDVAERAARIIEESNQETLLSKYSVQIFEPTGVGIVVHAVEHFSYHVGQITLLTKLATGEHTHYYDESKL